jgi:hypothetical protein
MGKINRIIKIKDVLYECLGTMSVKGSEEKGTEFWKKQWGADNVLRNGNDYYYCRTVIDAEFDDIL